MPPAVQPWKNFKATGVLREHAAQVPAVIGVSRLDLAPEFDLDSCATVAGWDDRLLPVMPIDAREREQGLFLMDVLMSEMETRDWCWPMADGQDVRRLEPAVRDRVAQHLQAFADGLNGVRSAVLASVDGFALVPAAGSHGNGERPPR